MNRLFAMSHDVPSELEYLVKHLIESATNLRWTWNHADDAFWETIDTVTWRISRNPYVILQKLSLSRLHQLANDQKFMRQLEDLSTARKDYLQRDSWADKVLSDCNEPHIAYFSMEFGLGEALPLYAGGLGILAGDYLKAASDLGVPVVGIGLMYDEGYFRQILDAKGYQQEVYAYNDSRNLPLQPVITEDGAWLSIAIEFPGRQVSFQVWQARVGRAMLYLLDSNDPLNSPADQGITGSLYGGSQELRLMQEIVLGIGGWRVIEALQLPITVCHLNEGHAAFAALERARVFKEQQQTEQRPVDFWQALWATRAGNLFTTHTPLAAAFDTFPSALLVQYGQAYAERIGIAPDELMALGQQNPCDHNEPFNMAYLAARMCARINGVSRLHGEVSRQLFQPLYPHWPEQEVPVTHITNGVHVPTWDSPHADKIWTDSCGKERWLDTEQSLGEAIMQLSDRDIWELRGAARADLVTYVRSRLAKQLGQRGESSEAIQAVQAVLDPNVLTLGFARRFTEYKRPNLLLHDQQKLLQLFNDSEKPLQLIIAGKAHPRDEQGKQYIKQWSDFIHRADSRQHVVFLEDYDIGVAQELVQGVDVWINTPRRPWEACGTSGMKVLANGGINLSVLDGWWAEAYKPELGWALGDGQSHSEAAWDTVTAQQLYSVLQQQVIPEFYHRDSEGIPRQWVQRIRLSMAHLAPQFSSNRMLREYVEKLYIPAQEDFTERTAAQAECAKSLAQWQQRVVAYWQNIHWGNLQVFQEGSVSEEKNKHTIDTRLEVQLYLADISPDDIQVQLFADAVTESVSELVTQAVSQQQPLVVTMHRGKSIAGSANGFVYTAQLATNRPLTDFTPRVVAYHRAARIPAELNMINWWSGER